MWRRLGVLAALLCLLAPVSADAATCPRTSLGDVENEVMCLVCGTPLGLATEAPQANRERALIQREVDACKSKGQVKDRLVAEYGEEVLALPKRSGFDLASYLVPALAVVLGTGAVTASALQWRRARRRGAGPGDSAPAPSTATSDRLQSDLDRYEL
ncbi:MAG: cytochrome c-type biogenesis protein [Thermoleophilaceae bacterium]